MTDLNQFAKTTAKADNRKHMSYGSDSFSDAGEVIAYARREDTEDAWRLAYRLLRYDFRYSNRQILRVIDLRGKNGEIAEPLTVAGRMFRHAAT